MFLEILTIAAYKTVLQRKADILKGIELSITRRMELSITRKMKSTETLVFLPLKVSAHLICSDNFSPKVTNKLGKKFH